MMFILRFFWLQWNFRYASFLSFKKGIIYVNASIEENILKPYLSQNILYQASKHLKKV